MIWIGSKTQVPIHGYPLPSVRRSNRPSKQHPAIPRPSEKLERCSVRSGLAVERGGALDGSLGPPACAATNPLCRTVLVLGEFADVDIWFLLSSFGTGVLSADGKAVADKKVPHTIPFLMAIDETFDGGIDLSTPVDDKDYQVPFRFTGKLSNVTIKLGSEQITDADREQMQKRFVQTAN
jgi:hypothetical protein